MSAQWLQKWGYKKWAPKSASSKERRAEKYGGRNRVSQLHTGVAARLESKARRVVIIQLLVTCIVAAIFLGRGLFTGQGLLAGQGPWDALSAAYGGLSSVILALISIGGFKRANQYALSDPKKSMIILYMGAVGRFVAVLVLLGIGLGSLKLAPLAVLIGFALAQASYLMGMRDGKKAQPHHPD